MSRLAITLAVLLSLAVCPFARADVSIEGPSEVEAGDYAQLNVLGLDAERLSSALVKYFPRERVNVIPAKTWAGDPMILFRAKNQGTYLLWVAAPGPTGIDQAEIEIQVGPLPNPEPIPPDPTPIPDPDPEPDPDPQPAPGVRQVTVVYESNNRTPNQTVAMISLQRYLSDTGHPYRFVDQHLADGETDRTPAWLLPYLAEIKVRNVQLPALVVALPPVGTEVARIVGIGSMPPDADKAIAFVQKHGG